MAFLYVLLFFVNICYGQVVAKINREVITNDQFQSYFSTYWREIVHLPITQATKEDMRNFLLEYIRARIIEREAKSMNISVSESELQEYIDKTIGRRNLSPIVTYMVRSELLSQKIVDRIARNIVVNDEQIVAYYYLNLRDFKRPSQVLLQRIFTDDLDNANKVYSALINDRVPTDAIYREGVPMWYSIQTLPQVVRNQLHPYDIGKVSKPIDTGSGYLILRVINKRGSGIIPLDEAKPLVREKLLKEKRQEVFTQWFQRVLRNYQLELYSF